MQGEILFRSDSKRQFQRKENALHRLILWTIEKYYAHSPCLRGAFSNGLDSLGVVQVFIANSFIQKTPISCPQHRNHNIDADQTIRSCMPATCRFPSIQTLSSNQPQCPCFPPSQHTPSNTEKLTIYGSMPPQIPPSKLARWSKERCQPRLPTSAQPRAPSPSASAPPMEDTSCWRTPAKGYVFTSAARVTSRTAEIRKEIISIWCKHLWRCSSLNLCTVKCNVQLLQLEFFPSFSHSLAINESIFVNMVLLCRKKNRF